jgi:hypothetical protein
VESPAAARSDDLWERVSEELESAGKRDTGALAWPGTEFSVPSEASVLPPETERLGWQEPEPPFPGAAPEPERRPAGESGPDKAEPEKSPARKSTSGTAEAQPSAARESTSGTAEAEKSAAGESTSATAEAEKSAAGESQSGQAKPETAAAGESQQEEAGDAAAGPARSTGRIDVTVVPGVARYHRSGCILIRFLGADDLEIMTRQEAESAGFVPCRACQPDELTAD